MKVSGPKGPGVVPPPSDDGAGTPQPTAATSFRELLDAPGSKAPDGPLNAAFAEIHARLRSGEINLQRASELLVESVVKSQLPEAAAVMQERLREVLRKLLRDDPVLAAKLQQLAEGER